MEKLSVCFFIEDKAVLLSLEEILPKTTKIADDVYSCMLKEDSILYLHDFSWNSYTGSLFRYENGNSEKISDDVNCIIF